MQRLYSFLSIFIVAAMMISCVPKAAALPAKVKAIDAEDAPTLTDLPEKPTPIASTTPETVLHDPPASCPITQPPNISFIPPAPYPAEPPERYLTEFWYGTSELWTMLGTGATWNALPHHKDGYTQKVFWWSRNFDVTTTPYPALTVTLERLDVPASPVVVSDRATNASADFGTAMLTGVDIPTLGCWKIKGQYQEAELSFVVWVAP